MHALKWAILAMVAVIGAYVALRLVELGYSEVAGGWGAAVIFCVGVIVGRFTAPDKDSGDALLYRADWHPMVTTTKTQAVVYATKEGVPGERVQEEFGHPKVQLGSVDLTDPNFDRKVEDLMDRALERCVTLGTAQNVHNYPERGGKNARRAGIGVPRR